MWDMDELYELRYERLISQYFPAEDPPAVANQASPSPKTLSHPDVIMTLGSLLVGLALSATTILLTA